MYLKRDTFLDIEHLRTGGNSHAGPNKDTVQEARLEGQQLPSD